MHLPILGEKIVTLLLRPQGVNPHRLHMLAILLPTHLHMSHYPLMTRKYVYTSICKQFHCCQRRLQCSIERQATCTHTHSFTYVKYLIHAHPTIYVQDPCPIYLQQKHDSFYSLWFILSPNCSSLFYTAGTIILRLAARRSCKESPDTHTCDPRN